VAQKQRKSAYPTKVRTIGDNLRTRRLDLGLLQRDVALRLGVSKSAGENWERGRTEPELRFLPAIIGFLGYDPRPVPETVGARVRHEREGQGLSQKEMARRMGIAPGLSAIGSVTSQRAGFGRVLGRRLGRVVSKKRPCLPARVDDPAFTALFLPGDSCLGGLTVPIIQSRRGEVRLRLQATDLHSTT
jgi:transcriptional regulator with XRE-family HTH domain